LSEPADVFIPPWNAWDANTIRAAWQSDLSYFSPDMHHADAPLDSRVKFFPQTQTHPRAALEWIRANPHAIQRSVMTLVTHPFDFEGAGGEAYFRDLRELLEYVQASADWRCRPAWNLPRVDREHFAKAAEYERTRDFLSDAIGGRLVRQPPSTMLAIETEYDSRLPAARSQKIKVLIATMIVGLIAGAGIAICLRKSPRLALGACAGGAIASIVLLTGAQAIVEAGYHVRAVRWQAIMVSLAWLGSFTYFARRAVGSGFSKVLALMDHLSAANRSKREGAGVHR
jgi:hypothetical protein